MPRLFIFAVGGTGIRVLKSLILLLAAGVKPNNDFEIIPIIIDPHQSNEDLKRTIDILDYYCKIYNKCNNNSNNYSGFFPTKISRLKDLVSNKSDLTDNFKFNLKDISDKKFSEYIGLNLFEENSSTKALLKILFSGNTVDKYGNNIDLLELNMDMGFIGNPNIGSIVLNQFNKSSEFKEFASNFNHNDRIFIISSIFGGTGAAGFPIILKNIRGAKFNNEIDSRGFLQNAKIGALTVLPYFNIKKEDKSPIQRSDFISKTKQALYYYKDNITGNDSINAMYYIGDDYIGQPYENDPGYKGQKNNAHFIEMVSALSVIDFLDIPDDQLNTINGEARNPIYKEFGIQTSSADIDSINFNHLSALTKSKIALPLTQFYLFYKYMNNEFNNAIKNQAWCKDKPEINLPLNYFQELEQIFVHFLSWLVELNNNKRSFSPFLINNDNKLNNIINGTNYDLNINYNIFNNKLNRNSRKGSFKNEIHKLINLFYISTEDLLKSNKYFKDLQQ